MKILFLSRKFYPDIGGVEKHVFEISKLLVKDGHHVTVVTQSRGKEKTINGINIIRIPKRTKTSSEKLHVWKWFWKNKYLIKEADIVHAHDVYWWYWPYRFIFLSKKNYVTFHGYETYPIRRKAIIFRRLSAFLATGNLAVGKFIEKLYGTKADFVIYGGVNTSGSSVVKTVKSKAIFIGRLDVDTGILDYLNAERVISKKIKDFKLFVIGEGKYSNKINLGNRKNFTSNYRKDLESSEVVFSSSYLMILEALSLGKPVFSIYNNDLKKDYLEDTPFKNFIWIANSTNALSNNVIRYFNDKKIYHIKIDKGRKWAKNQTWDTILKTYLTIWNYK